MSDFPAPSQQVTDTHVTFANPVYGPTLRSTTPTSFSTAFTWVSGLAVYTPVTLSGTYIVRRVWWLNGSTNASTSVDMGIYTASGVRIYSTTPTVMGTVAVAQYVSLSAPLLLTPGNYYLAWTCNNTTSRAAGYTFTADQGQRVGLLQQSSVATLPATATSPPTPARGCRSAVSPGQRRGSKWPVRAPAT